MRISPTEFKIVRSSHKLHFQFTDTQNSVNAKFLILKWLKDNIEGDFEEGKYGVVPELVLNGDQMDEFDTKAEEFYFWIDNDYKKLIADPKEARKEARKVKGQTVEKRNVSFFETPEFLYEQIYKDNKNKFVEFNKSTNEFYYIDSFEFDRVEYFPIDGDEIIKKAVILPSGIKPYKSIEDLDNQIMVHINKWLDVDNVYVRLAAWNIRFSWVYDKFHTLNYLRALGDTGSGKSRYLDTISKICYKPIMMSGALTVAPVFRLINKWKGTLVVDEADLKESDESNEFIKILNCGYERDRPIIRCDKNDPNKIDIFEVYGPKVISTRRRFEDKATEARCMTKIMIQTTRNDIPDILTSEFYIECEDIRQQLLYYRLKNYNSINPDAGLSVDLNFVEPRLRQVNRGFISLFADNPKQIHDFKEYLHKYQYQIIEERAETRDGVIVNAIAHLMVAKKAQITPQLIADKANELNPVLDNKHSFNSRAVGKSCKTLGLEFERIRVQDETTNESKVCNLMQVNKEKLATLFSRYLVEKELIENVTLITGILLRVMNVTFICESPEKCNTLIKPQNDKKELGGRYQRNKHNNITDFLEKNAKKTFVFSEWELLLNQSEISNDDSEALLNELIMKGFISEIKPGLYQIGG
jgi:hypothetical protein